MPENLDAAVAVEESLYGLEVQPDLYKPGDLDYLSVRPLEYARAAQLTHFRYLIELPGGDQMTVTRDGQLAPFDRSTGWHRGEPYSFSVPLPATGSYLFVIETMDRRNHVSQRGGQSIRKQVS